MGLPGVEAGPGRSVAASRKPKRPRGSKRLAQALAHPDVQAVVEAYRETFRTAATWSPETKRNGKPRAVAVLDALERGLTVEDLRRAIAWNRASSWHRDNGHQDLELIARKAEDHLQRAAAPAAKRPPPPSTGPRRVSTDVRYAATAGTFGKRRAARG